MLVTSMTAIFVVVLMLGTASQVRVQMGVPAVILGTVDMETRRTAVRPDPQDRECSSDTGLAPRLIGGRNFETHPQQDRSEGQHNRRVTQTPAEAEHEGCRNLRTKPGKASDGDHMIDFEGVDGAQCKGGEINCYT